MKKLLTLFFLLVFFSIYLDTAFAYHDDRGTKGPRVDFSRTEVLEYPVSLDNKIEIPQFTDVTCKFDQVKSVQDSHILSRGNFQFISGKGVIFETLYPVKYTTSYTSKENKYVNDIILGISKKKFSNIEKNFDIFFQKKYIQWMMILKPKSDSPAANHLKDITISGGNRNITSIVITPINNGYTKIQFSQCSQHD